MPAARPLADALRRPGAVLLDGPLADADTGRAGAWLFAAPRETFVARTLDEVAPLLDALDAALAGGHHVAGWLAYEAAAALEPRLAPRARLPAEPLAWFGAYDAPEAISETELRAAFGTEGRVTDVHAGITEAEYHAGVARVREHIRQGDIYQVNLTWPLAFEVAGDGLDLYGAMRERQPTAYGAWVRTSEVDVLSLSPELFFRVGSAPEAGSPEASGGARVITARPMKGTAPRGNTPRADDALARALTADAKNRAENLMIVDLLRNDLARVAAPGSVRVPQLFHAERYPTVTQMTSTVQADLARATTLGAVLRALFPCGSVTGAPKLRAMRVIREFEAAPRGVYCGAVGYAAPAPGGGLGSASFNVPIRTAVVREGRGEYRVGSGIVWDSDAGAEWEECWLKARPLTDLASGEAAP